MLSKEEHDRRAKLATIDMGIIELQAAEVQRIIKNGNLTAAHDVIARIERRANAAKLMLKKGV